MSFCWWLLRADPDGSLKVNTCIKEIILFYYYYPEDPAVAQKAKSFLYSAHKLTGSKQCLPLATALCKPDLRYFSLTW